MSTEPTSPLPGSSLAASLPCCQSLAHTLTSLYTYITNPVQDLQHVSCLTSLTRLQLSINFAQASQPGLLDHMTAQIAQITGLKALQLYDFPHSFTKSMSHGLPNLQELVSNGVGPVLDVQHCTQLTSLTVADGADITGLKQVHLPAGQTCCLEQLSVDIFSEEGAGYTLSNLDDALKLSSLAFRGSYPCNLLNVQNISSASSGSSSAGPWPPLMHSLHRLSIIEMPCAPPAVWAQYGSLCEVDATPTGPPSLWCKRLPLKQSVGSSIPDFSDLGI